MAAQVEHDTLVRSLPAVGDVQEVLHTTSSLDDELMVQHLINTFTVVKTFKKVLSHDSYF